MPRIRHIDITHFRSLKRFSWHPSPGINCLIGAGDSGKSTVLDAIDLCLGARRNIQFSDADFHDVDVGTAVRIAVTVGELDDTMKQLDSYGLFIRGYRTDTSSIEDEPDEGELALTVLLTVSQDLEPTWTLHSERAAAQNQTRMLNWSDRVRLAPTWVGDYASHHLSWRKGSVLNRLSDDRADLGNALAKVARDARLAFGDTAGKQLSQTLDVVTKTAIDLGIETGGAAKALLGADAVSFVAGTVSLHTDGGVPLSALGLGSARLLVAGLQREAAAQSSMILIDELEHGLEPHRIIQLVGRLGAKEKSPPLQAFATTHSPTVLRELEGSQLFVLRAAEGVHQCLCVGKSDALQGTIRRHPEAFLAKAALVCEGATEVGLLRGLDRWFSDQGSTSFAALGVVLVDGAGVKQLIGRASAFGALGVRAAIFRDDDERPDEATERKFIQDGGRTFKWRDGLAVEEALFHSAPDDCVRALVERAIDLHGDRPVDDHIRSASDGAIKLADCVGVCNAAQRLALGKAAKSGKWFKSVTRMENAAYEILGPHFLTTEEEFRNVVKAAFDWASIA